MNDKRISGNSNRELIELYLTSEEGSVQLTDKQKELLQRWTFVDEKIRTNEMRRETLAQLVMHVFKVSRVTAYQDIVNTEAVFSSSTPLNKKYRIQLRIEFLEAKIQELYGMVHTEPVDEVGNALEEEEEDLLVKVARIGRNQEYIHEAKELEKILQKYYHDYPDTTPPRSPKKIVLNIQYNELPAAPLTFEDAMEKAKAIIHLKAKNNDGSDDQS